MIGNSSRPTRLGLAVFVAVVIQWVPSGAKAAAERTSSAEYHFDGTISRRVLENYLSRAITVEGMFNGRGDLDDNIRMLKNIGARYAGRSLCLWVAERNFLADVERAKREVPKARAADPDMIFEACVFEIVTPRIEQIAIPDWVFTNLGQPVEKRNFIFNNMG